MSTLGRPVELTETKKNEFCALLAAGFNIKHAAQFIGCSARTVRRHAAVDEAFRQRLRKAEANIRLTALETIRKAAATNWKAAIWLVQNAGGLEGPPEDYACRKAEFWEEFLEEQDEPSPRETDRLPDLRPLGLEASGHNDEP